MPNESIIGMGYDAVFLQGAEPVDILNPLLEVIGYRVTAEHTGIVEQMHECLKMVFKSTGEENAEQV